MKFVLSVVFPVLLGFLFSCSSAKLYYSSLNTTGGYHTTSAEKQNPGLAYSDVTSRTSNQEVPVFASSEPNSFLLEAAPQEASKPLIQLPEPRFEPEAATADLTQINHSPEKPHTNKSTGIFPENTHKLAIVAVAAGILAFAPFVLSLSLLYAIPFAITGIICGRIAMRDLRTNRMRKGIALAKAGFLMSSVVAIILVLLGALALFG